MYRKQFIYSLSTLITGFGIPAIRTDNCSTREDSLYHLLLSEEEMQKGVALLQVGNKNSTVSVIISGNLEHRQTIPFGTRGLYDFVEIWCNISSSNASSLIMNYGNALPQSVDPTAWITVRKRGGEEIKVNQRCLADKIIRHMETIFNNTWWVLRNSGYSTNLNAGMVIAGDLSHLNEMQYLGENCTGLDCRVADLRS